MPETHIRHDSDLTPDGEPSRATLAQRLRTALETETWGNPWPRAAHGEHRYDGGCAICRSDVEAILAVVLHVIEPEALATGLAAFHAQGDLPARILGALRTVGLARNLSAYRDAVLPIVQTQLDRHRERAEQAEAAIERVRAAARPLRDAMARHDAEPGYAQLDDHIDAQTVRDLLATINQPEQP